MLKRVSIRALQYNALIHSRGHRATLVELINQKEIVGDLFNQLRLALQRRTKERPAQVIDPIVYSLDVRFLFLLHAAVWSLLRVISIVKHLM